MALPAGVVTCVLTFGAAKTFTGDDVQTGIEVIPSQDVVWAATGQPLVAFTEVRSGTTNGSITLPVVDQPGFRGSDGAPVTMWSYTIIFTYTSGLLSVRRVTRIVQPVSGQATIDLDLVPDSSAAAPVLGVIPTVTSWNGQTGDVFYTPPGGGGGGSDYTWVIAGTSAGKAAFDPATLEVGTVYVAEDGGATPKPWFVTTAHTWALLASAGHHAEAHATGGSDPMTYASIGAAPASLEDTVAELVTLVAVSAGGSSGGSAAIEGLVNHGDVPLGGADVFRSAPIDTAGSVNTRIYVIADQSFTARLDTSADAVTFTTGATLYSSTSGFSGHILAQSVAVASRYVRLTVTCGATGMQTFSADTLNNGILG